ncbi:MAG: B12-binding domain-containing radical SAM protein [Thermoplasmatales archaeon]|nr:B12-binding domain-containing radical SAM protein [Thermoplasmatales archaeon]
MKFLLLRPGDREKIHRFSIISPLTVPPLGLLYLGAVLERDGHKVELLDFYAEDISREQLKNSLMSSDAVGMMVYTDDFKLAVDISRMIKEINPEIPLIIGGPHCTFFQKRSLSNIPDADISVIGEGEQVILDIVRFLQGSENLSDIHGIYYRDNGSIMSGKPLQVIDNLDALPFPARHLVEKYDYGSFAFGYTLKKRVTALNTSKGCPFHCSFCTRYGNFIKDWGFRKRSAENVVNEIQEINGKYRSVVIVDDNFLADKKRTHRIFDMLLETDTNIEFLIQGARVDTADKELYLKMKKAGIKYIFYGLESGNQDVLDYYNKNITLQQIRKATTLARETGFFIAASFIFGAPIETKKHVENTIKFACSLPLDLANFVPLIYRMGSPLWVEAVKNKKISPSQYDALADLSHNLGNFTEDELIEFTTNAFKTFYFRPKYILGQIYNSLSRKDYNLLIFGLKSFILINKTSEKIKKVIKSKNIT